MPLLTKRRSDRISIELPIQVVGNDADGSQFMEHGHTLLISRHGGLIVLRRKLSADSEFTLVNTQLKDEGEARIVGHIASNPDGEVYGVALLDAGKNLWHIDFPPMDEAEVALGRVLLECVACHKQDVVHFTEVELEVFQAKQELIRSCPSCARTTVWKQTESGAGAELAAVAKSESKGKQRGKERRRHARKSVKLVACIRLSGTERMVNCEDVSRGGFSFTSKKSYQTGSEVDAAMPYSRAGGNIFLPARIAHCQERSPGFYKCGVAYKKTP